MNKRIKKTHTQTPRLAYSLQETADMLGLSYFTIWRLVARGKLKASTAARKRIVSLEEIKKFLKA